MGPFKNTAALLISSIAYKLIKGRKVKNNDMEQNHRKPCDQKPIIYGFISFA
jgi:hypothetical protein